MLCWIPFKADGILKSFLAIILQFKTEEAIRSNLIIMEMFSQYIYEPLFKKKPAGFSEISSQHPSLQPLIDTPTLGAYPDHLTPTQKKLFLEKLKIYVEKIYSNYKEIYFCVQIQEKKNHEIIMEKGEVDYENQNKLNELLDKYGQYDSTITMMKDY